MIITFWHDNSSPVFWRAFKLEGEGKRPGIIMHRAQCVGLCYGIPNTGRQVLSGDGVVEM